MPRPKPESAYAVTATGRHVRVAAAAVAAALATAGPAVTAAPAITAVLPAPAEAGIDVQRVSRDGRVVTGEAGFGGNAYGAAFRWTAATGTQEVGRLPGGTNSRGSAVSADGSVVVGYGDNGATDFTAFRWSAGGGFQQLGNLPGGSQSLAYDVSADGAVVVGQANTDTGTVRGLHAFRWTAATGLQDLGTLPGGTQSLANNVSADGSVVAGFAAAPAGDRAFRWTAAGGLQPIAPLAGDTRTTGIGLSADGSTVVGYSASRTDGADNVAFRWTAATGTQLIPAPAGVPADAAAFAAAVSGDGNAVVGNVLVSAAAYRPFLWTPALGTVDLNAYLPTIGVDLTGWTLHSVTDISDDGTAILGYGTHDGRPDEAFLVTGVPEPAGAALVFTLAGLATCGRRGRA
jgi:probable HAF family extracellular repeat protein